MRATQDPGTRLIASLAMAESDDDSGRAVLANVVDAVPAGHELWRRAAGGLAKLGDANARKLLEGELAQSDAVRSVWAAESLACADDARAREVLARVVADKALRGVVTRHWRLLGSATGVCSNGPATPLASSDARTACSRSRFYGTFFAGAAANTGAIAALAIDDPDLRVRMTAEAVVLGL